MQRTTLDATILQTCVSAAVAAPSIFNSQPWRFRLDPDAVAFEVWAAPEHGLPHTDPVGRALHLSVGACVLNLRVAMAHHGWAPVTRLLPRPEDPDLLATVHPTEPAPGAPVRPEADLYEAIWRRHSSRFPYADLPLPEQVRADLSAAARAEGALLDFPGQADTAWLLELTARGEQRTLRDADRATESRRWVQRDPYLSADTGLPPAALGPQDAHEHLPMRDFTAQRHPERLSALPFERRPVVALLTTEHDRRADWLRAGQALEHVLLVATAHDLRASLLHQALEWPDLRARMHPTTHPQMLLRLGYGPPGPATPRRPAHKVTEHPPTNGGPADPGR
ncbi:Acg family FMN-binding oxidoreductase [Streptomyces sp. NPDC018693]|uniref:Acg family FMN-binding oxidoreductase n=1 Tax=unclassified Streptomyces TaxID=2593676 RepID=UPI0037AC5FFE